MARMGVFQYFETLYGNIPFTLESAMLFYYADYYDQHGSYPVLDQRAQYPEGLPVVQKHSVGKDIMASSIHHLFFRSMDFAQFLRYFIPIFFCLGIPALYLIVLWWTKSDLAASIASLFYGLGLPALIRSTGMEYSSENFSLPFIFWHFLLMMVFIKHSFNRLINGCIGSLSIVALGIAVATWDMSQVYLYTLIPVWMILLFKKNPLNSERIYLGATLFFLHGVGWLVPYLKDHQFCFSTGLLLLDSVWIVSFFKDTLRPSFKVILVILITGLLGYFLTPYRAIYQHMSSLLWEKLWFLGQKPQDPAYLSYSVRSLWVPALHSAFEGVQGVKHWTLFQRIWLCAIGPWMGLCFKCLRKKALQEQVIVLYWVTIYFILFILFSRFEVFFAFFLSMLLGLSVVWLDLKLYRKAVWLVILVAFLGWETQLTATHFVKWGRSVDYAQLQDIVGWVDKNCTQKDVILAEFGLSPSFLAYTDSHIVLHPKFESMDMRNKVKEFVEDLFQPREQLFYKLCEKWQVDYYVHTMGMDKDESIFSWRYLANALGKKEVIVSRFENQPKELDHFEEIYHNDKYRVYKIVKHDDILKANELVDQANLLIQKENIIEAEQVFRQAIQIYPKLSRARLGLSKVLKIQGRYEEAVTETKEALLWMRLRSLDQQDEGIKDRSLK